VSDQPSTQPTLHAARDALATRNFAEAHRLALTAVQADATHADGWFVLGVIAAEHANHAKAIELLQRAISHDASRAEYHAQLARCLIAQRLPREAHAAAQRGLDLQPSDAYTLDTLGVALTRAGEHAEAVAPFRAAVVRAPAIASYRYNLGSALQFIGDLGGAASEFRAALRVQPRYWRAWSGLLQVAADSLSADERATIETQLEGESAGSALTVDQELHLCHALAKCLELEGRHAESMAVLARGKARKRAALDYSVEHDLALFRAAVEAAPAGKGGHASAEPIFIVGMPRTGTTLVERILSSHPAVFAAGELGHFSLAVKRATGTATRHVLDGETLHAAQRLDHAALGAAYIESTRPRTGHTSRFIDKMPLNVFYAGLIHAALPKARILCLRRHPLDACLSNYRQLFATGFSYYNYALDLADCGRYWCAFDDLCRHWSSTLGAAWCEVHYEHVVADIEDEARRLLAFCGLDWHPDCIAFHTNTAPVATASAAQVREPLYTRAVGRWQRYGELLAPLKEVLGDRLERWSVE